MVNDDNFLYSGFCNVESKVLTHRRDEKKVESVSVSEMHRREVLKTYYSAIVEAHSRRKGSAGGDIMRQEILKRGLSGTIDGLKVSALADTGAAQNVVSSSFARARKLEVACSRSSFRLGNSKLAHSSGTSKNGFDNMTKWSDVII